MNVLYAPQPIGDAPFNAKLGENVLVGIELLSNPMPDKVQWTMTTSSEEDNTTATIDLVNGDKYVIEDLVDLGDERYRADLTIDSVTEADVKASYHLILTNSVESVSYEFKLTTASEPIPPVVSNNVTMFVLIAVGCVIILIAILVAIYKKCSSSENETSPLIN